MAEGLADIFRQAGADWRDAGCSMCIAMNGDQLAGGQYCVSTSNRNFEGRQGKGGGRFWPARSRRRQPRSRASRRPARIPVEGGTIHAAGQRVSRESRPAAEQRCRHRPDHSRTLPEDDREAGSGRDLFNDWRYSADGSPNPDFVLNQPRATEAASCWQGTTLAAEARANTPPGRCSATDSRR